MAHKRKRQQTPHSLDNKITTNAESNTKKQKLVNTSSPSSSSVEQNKEEEETLNTSIVHVQHIIPKQKIMTRIQQQAKKYLANKQKKKIMKTGSNSSSDESDSEDDSSDDDSEELVEAVSKFPIAYSTQLSENCPFSRFIYYKKHYGLLKEDSQKFTSSFNQQLLLSQDGSSSGSNEEEEEDSSNKDDNGEGDEEDAGEVKELVKERSKNLTLFMTNVHYNQTPEQIARFFEQNFDARLNKCILSDLHKQQQQAMEKGEEALVLNSIIDHPFEDSRTNHFLSSGTVHVILNEQSKMNQVLLAPELNSIEPKKPFIEDPIDMNESAATGVERYRNEYKSNQIRSNHVEQAGQELNKWMMDFDRAEKHEEQLIEALRNQKDEDGWTKVVAPKGKRYLPPLHKDDILQKSAGAKRPSKFKDQVQMPFYKYQKAEQKKREVQLLREKFEQDKQLIEKMKNNKQFKPF